MKLRIDIFNPLPADVFRNFLRIHHQKSGRQVAIARIIPGVLNDESSALTDSYQRGIREYLRIEWKEGIYFVSLYSKSNLHIISHLNISESGNIAFI